MVAWIHALHIQIGISSENHRLYEAEILITEDVSIDTHFVLLYFHLRRRCISP
jgi:hypothetical protein